MPEVQSWRPWVKEDMVHASIIDMTLLLPVDQALFDELRADFLPRAAQHPGFRGFQYVLADQGRAVGILWYDQPEDLDGITQLAGTWFQDHIAPRLAGPETAIRGRVVVNMTAPRTPTALTTPPAPLSGPEPRDRSGGATKWEAILWLLASLAVLLVSQGPTRSAICEQRSRNECMVAGSLAGAKAT